MTKMQGGTHSLDDLHEHSVALISNAHRLRQQFTRLRQTSMMLRGKSIQLRDDSRKLRNWGGVKNLAAYSLQLTTSATAMRTFDGVPNSVQANSTSSPSRAIRGKPLEREMSVFAITADGPSVPSA